MELQGEDGNVTIHVHEGEVKVLGRSSLPVESDRTVSEKQVILQMVRCTGPEGCRISVEVVGQNPICIYRAGDKSEMNNLVDQTVDFLDKGEKSWLALGDKISLSISQPHFLTVQEAPVGGVSVAHPTDLIQLKEQQEQLPGNDNDDPSTRLGRRPEAATGAERRASGQGTILSSHRPAIEPESLIDADLATEFGLVVEGSEFDPYERKTASTSREWTWRIGKKAAEKNSDDEEDEEEEWKPMPSTMPGASSTGGGREKRKAVELEEGEDEEGRQRRSRGRRGSDAAAGPSRPAGRAEGSPSSQGPGVSSVTTRGKSGAEGDVDLEGFIVEDEEEEEEAEEADVEEEEEEWEDEGDDDEEEEDDTWLEEEEEGAGLGRGSGPARGTRRSEQKPMCKYGSTCFRKNPQHLAEFRHAPS